MGRQEVETLSNALNKDRQEDGGKLNGSYEWVV